MPGLSKCEDGWGAWAPTDLYAKGRQRMKEHTMRIRYLELRGREVVALAEGRLLGPIRRVTLDSRTKRIVGLAFRGKLTSTEVWVEASTVERLGEDVVFLASAAQVLDGEPPGRDARDVLDLQVTTTEGSRLGTVRDLVIDTETWTIAAVVIEAAVEIPISEGSVLGEDALLLQTDLSPPAGPSGPSGFLSRLYPRR